MTEAMRARPVPAGYVRDRQGRLIPRQIARLAAGRHAYLRESVVDCVVCGDDYVLKSSDSAELCVACWDEAGEENARLDGLR